MERQINHETKCKNYKWCQTMIPNNYFENTLICIYCTMAPEQVPKIIDNITCTSCYKITHGIKHPNCNHTFCIECFKKCYNVSRKKIHELVFPYAQIEDEYLNNPYDPKWDKYPLIQEYYKQYNKLEQEIEDEIQHNILNICLLCKVYNQGKSLS